MTRWMMSGVTHQGFSDRFVNSHHVSEISSFCVTNLRNRELLAAIHTLNMDILDHNLLFLRIDQRFPSGFSPLKHQHHSFTATIWMV